MKLIPEWRKAHKFLSVQLGTIGTILTSILVTFPEVALVAWSSLPTPLQQSIPPQWMPLIGVSIFVLSIVGRLIRQDSLNDKN